MSVSAGVCGGGEVRWLGGVGCGCGVKLGGWGGVGGVEVGWLGCVGCGCGVKLHGWGGGGG